MVVAVVGCGAVGSLFAANLATLDDVEVWAYDLSHAHVDAINRDGLRLTGAGEVTARLRATTDASELPTFFEAKHHTLAEKLEGLLAPNGKPLAHGHADVDVAANVVPWLGRVGLAELLVPKDGERIDVRSPGIVARFRLWWQRTSLSPNEGGGFGKWKTAQPHGG